MTNNKCAKIIELLDREKATMGMNHTLYLSLMSESEKAISRLGSPWDVDNYKQLSEK